MQCEDMYCRIDGPHRVCGRCGNSELTVVVHIDIDYFFAQVEERERPELKKQPFGVQQNMEVAAVNYLARGFGLYNRISVKEALRRCPDLVLVRGQRPNPNPTLPEIGARCTAASLIPDKFEGA